LDQPTSVQIHDFNPGITPSGLFWTIPFPASQVSINLDNGTASMWATDWTIDDYTNIGNSLGDVPPLPVLSGTVSFKVNWTANGKPTQMPNTATPTDSGFAGLFINSKAQLWWSADEPAGNFKFESDPADTSKSISGVIGKERNGRFYPPGG